MDHQQSTSQQKPLEIMNEPQLLSIHYPVFVDKTTPGKQADEGVNAWISNMNQNGIQVQFTLDSRK